MADLFGVHASRYAVAIAGQRDLVTLQTFPRAPVTVSGFSNSLRTRYPVTLSQESTTMHKSPLIFVSYSQHFTKLKNLIVALLGDIGFRAEAFDYGSPPSPIAVQKDLIGACDGFVALLTPDQEIANGRNICSESVTTEIGMAYSADKPMQIFAFNDVDFAANQGAQATTVAKITTLQGAPGDVIAFDEENVRQLLRALLEFKKRIDSIEDLENTPDAFISYRKFHIEQHVLSRTELRVRNVIDAVALKNLDTHTHEGRLLCDRAEGEGVELIEGKWSFKLFRPVGTAFAVRVPENSRSAFRFYIDFEPPIQTGTEMKYAYQRNPFNYIPYTSEELDAAIADDRIHNRVMMSKRMVGQDFIVTQPTELLSVVMTFPAGYPIRNYEALACEYRSDQVNRQETERVNDFVRHDHDDFDDIHTLCLELPQPRANCSYFLLYTPPRNNEIRETEAVK